MDQLEQVSIREPSLASDAPHQQAEGSHGFLVRERRVHTDATLKGRKALFPHRLHLIDGRVIEGNLYREPGSRLSDDLYGMKGDFVCVLDACCTRSGRLAPFMVVNLHHIVMVEEL